MNKKIGLSKIIQILLIVFFAVNILLPLSGVFYNAAQTDYMQILASVRFLEALKNSLLVSVTSTIIVLFLALTMAIVITKSGIRYKGTFTTLFTLPMLIPSISHGTGIIMLLGKNGILTNILGLDFEIYGFIGITIGSSLYAFPPTFLLLYDILKYEDHLVYAAADILGIPKWRQFIQITLPYLKKPLISVIFATFTLIITDYGVPMLVGGKYMTLPVLMYQEVLGMLDFAKGSVIGIILLMPALFAFIADIFNKDTVNGNVSEQKEIRDNYIRDILSYFLCIGVSAVVMLPIASFILLTFVKKYPINMSISLSNISRTFQMGGGRYLYNSLCIAVLTAFMGVVISYVTAYFTSRYERNVSKFLHLISISSLAIPGIVLGFAYVLTFKSNFIYGTIGILILVNMVHFFSSPYLLAYNAFGKIDKNIENVGATLGIGRRYLLKDVFIPQTMTTILEMFAYFFVNAMITISAVSFLATMDNMPISLMLTQFESQMLIECSAFVALLILMVNLFAKLIIYIINNKLQIKSEV